MTASVTSLRMSQIVTKLNDKFTVRISKLNTGQPAMNQRPRLYRQCKTRNPYYRIMDAGSVSLGDLPTEILLHVFSYLNTYELFSNVRPVCKRFLALTEAGTLWENVRVPQNVPPYLLTKWLRDFGKYVRHFSTAGRDDGNEMLNQVSKFCKNLESISVVNIFGTEKTPSVKAVPLCNIVTRCKRLRRINLRDCSFLSCRFFKLMTKHQAQPIIRTEKKCFEYDGPISRKQMFALHGALLEEKMLNNCIVILHHKTYKIYMQNFMKIGRKRIIEGLF